MKDYIEGVLHVDVNVRKYEQKKQLPLALRSAFEYNILTIGGSDCLFAEPLGEYNLAELRKQQKALEFYSGMRCALFLKKMNYYAMEKMLDEGIPFVWEKHQVYLPFLGFWLSSAERRQIRPCGEISFLTQKLLLRALYEGWQDVNVTKAAEALQVSKMSVTRCFDELQMLCLPYLTVRSRARKITCDKDKKTMWKILQPFLRNPVISTFCLKDELREPSILSGVSALAEYSLLSEDDYPTFAVTKKDIGTLNLAELDMVPNGDTPGCVVHEIGYFIQLGERKLVDPLSLALIMAEASEREPRIALAVREMLEAYVW